MAAFFAVAMGDTSPNGWPGGCPSPLDTERKRCNNATITELPDYRRESSATPEGKGLALLRWREFSDNLPLDVLEDAFATDLSPTRLEDLDAVVADEIAAAVVEDSELIGFWIAWHQAGGFGGLERGGWHRATIFRKVRRFRARYGAHPDEHRFPWIRLDLRRAWSDDIRNRLHPQPEPDL
jgi:hypothetical protein